jgi:hypothetical protein
VNFTRLEFAERLVFLLALIAVALDLLYWRP